ncbi:MAG: transcription antitermination protein NusB [Proteobacteria bacterium]|jgi:N utilization substance protein B|nr:transcription antitermination protein NusB [Pseudomonadota bacterium]NCV99176.1 transcription antitermination protein NusB [Pseudomonadota bacterium]NCW10480.1 transcription antitermination protein NusB [Pseudomonadota bacterium]NCW37799.1 transcription antitermination protein NusB [Pseudomonadota bacterium]NCX41889.1 transcription antitermination protein NusB [Pseudomonadota bacterium]|tara:strand:- start:775 stop:1185 length:411 start_codon:yes stop_codon:yes gene_type:complete
MKNLANFKIQIRTREYLVQAIYQYFFNNQDISDIVDQFKDEHKNKKVDFDKFSSSLESIQKNKSEFKEILDSMNVKDSNMDLIDKSILYFALNEMIYGELDKPVIIDESLRLSKKFSSPESYKFINANLDKYLKLN